MNLVISFIRINLNCVLTVIARGRERQGQEEEGKMGINGDERRLDLGW